MSARKTELLNKLSPEQKTRREEDNARRAADIAKRETEAKEKQEAEKAKQMSEKGGSGNCPNLVFWEAQQGSESPKTIKE